MRPERATEFDIRNNTKNMSKEAFLMGYINNILA
jgi:hypothetical protein